MGCILDDCEELIEKERKQREEFERTGFQPDCKRCSHHNYIGNDDYKVCQFEHNPKHCGSYRELDHREVLDRMENLSERINKLRANLHFLEQMDDEYKDKNPTEENRKFTANLFGIKYPEEDEPDSDEEDDEVDIDELEKTSFELPKKMR